jgi:methylphosphotriester-DNA--protein-cysteine methyltransferase
MSMIDYRVRVKRIKPSGQFSAWFEEIVFRITAEGKTAKEERENAAQMAESVLELHHIFKGDGLEMTVELYERRRDQDES